jgi:hypothetical protein
MTIFKLFCTSIFQAASVKDGSSSSNQDKRRVLITLSEKCKDLLALAPPPLQETFTNSFSQIEEWEQLMILSSMNRIVKMMSAESIDAPS